MAAPGCPDATAVAGMSSYHSLRGAAGRGRVGNELSTPSTCTTCVWRRAPPRDAPVTPRDAILTPHAGERRRASGALVAVKSVKPERLHS